MPCKKYVTVTARFDATGLITPLYVIWDDGRVFTVDRILDVRKAASLKAGGVGLRYTVRIKDKETYLWYEDPSWFVECKE